MIQLDEPWVRNNPEAGQALRGEGDQPRAAGHHGADGGASVLRLCGGGAGLDKPAGYSFLAELADTIAEQISIEAAQPKLDLGVLQGSVGKEDHARRARPRRSRDRDGRRVAERIRDGLNIVAPDRLVAAPDCGMKYMPRDVAFGKLKAMCEAAAAVRKEIG